jgi:hypothetical protein
MPAARVALCRFRPRRIGGNCAPQRFGGDVADGAVFHHPCGVEDPAQRRHLSGGCGDQVGNGAGVADVDGLVSDLGTGRAPCTQAALGLFAARTASADDDQMSRAVGHQPIGERKADRAETAGDQIGGVCLQ